MSGTFRDLDDLLAEAGGEPPIELPIRGKTYQFPRSISALSGLAIARMAAAAAAEQAGKGPADPDLELLDDAQEVDLRAEIMGTAEVEMARDGLTTAHTRHVFLTLLIWHLAGEEAALAAWESPGKPAPNRATRRSAAAATTTRRRASTSGTTLVAVAPAPKAAGRKSSATGR